VANESPPSITIALSPAQVDAVVRGAAQSNTPSVAALVGRKLAAATGASEDPVAAALIAKSDPRLSRSLLRGLSLLTCFDGENSPRGIVEMAKDLGMSPSTAHRYALTLLQVGLLERAPDTRKYLLPNLD
jgi:IclR helix-turn-helix domain